LRDDGQPLIKVLDFGVAKVIAESTTAAGGTQSLGTPLYMAPEQFHAEVRLTGAADVYALGMIAYTLLVGAPYWAPDVKKVGNSYAFALAAMHGPPQPASVRAVLSSVMLPPAFDAWFARMTARDPAYRFPTATGAVAALAEALGVSSPPAGFSLKPTGVSLGGLSQSEIGAAPLPGPGATAPIVAPVLPAALTPSGAAMTGVQPDRSRGSRIAVALGVGIAVLGGATAVLLRPSRTAPSASMIADPGAATPVPAAPASAASPAAAKEAPVLSAAPVSASSGQGVGAPPSSASAAPRPARASARPPTGKPAAPAAGKPSVPTYSQD
jgi:hypothetical protein